MGSGMDHGVSFAVQHAEHVIHRGDIPVEFVLHHTGTGAAAACLRRTFPAPRHLSVLMICHPPRFGIKPTVGTVNRDFIHRFPLPQNSQTGNALPCRKSSSVLQSC